MAVKSSGHLKLAAVASEFSDGAPFKMSEFYNGGTAGVDDTDVPSSGNIEISDFYGISAQSIGTLYSSVGNVNEGSSVTFTLPVTGYANGYTFPYSISGIQSADISQGLTGNMTVSGSNATVTITAVADAATEGAQTMTFTCQGQSKNVTINDTSQAPSYSVSVRSNPINEGSWQYIDIVYSGHSGNPTISATFTPTGASEYYNIYAVSNCTVSSVNYSAGTFNLTLSGSSGTATIGLMHGADDDLDGQRTARFTFGSPINGNTGNYTVNDTFFPWVGCYGLAGGLSSGYDSINFQFHRNAYQSNYYGRSSNFINGSNLTGGAISGGNSSPSNSIGSARYWKTMVLKIGGLNGTDVGYFTWNNPQHIYWSSNQSGNLQNRYLNNSMTNGNLNPTSNGGWSQDLSSQTDPATYVRFRFDTLSFHSTTYSSAASWNRYNQFYLFDDV